jgi:starch phosphorylase
LGIEPLVYHLNEGHPALATVELVSQRTRAGNPPGQAWEQVRQSVVFTTHTPVTAGNETYPADEFLAVLGRITDLTGDRERFRPWAEPTPRTKELRPGCPRLPCGRAGA